MAVFRNRVDDIRQKKLRISIYLCSQWISPFMFVSSSSALGGVYSIQLKGLRKFGGFFAFSGFLHQ